MRVVLQRVSEASVAVGGSTKSSIKNGILVLLGICDDDTHGDIEWLCKKMVNMRIFNDEAGVMNLSVQEIDGEIIVISQFTLYASTKKGNRPGYIKASKPPIAVPLYEKFLTVLSLNLGKPVQSGEFGEDMKVHLVNDGPVTIVIDSKNRE